MYVFHAWKSSLELFLPKNLSLFLLVTLKLLRDGLTTYFTYAWPFFIISFIGFIMGASSFDVYGRVMHNGYLAQHMGERTAVMIAISFAYLMIQLSCTMCSFLVALSMRPSVDKKNCAYMRRCTKKYFFGYLLLQIIFLLLGASICGAIAGVCCILGFNPMTSFYASFCMVFQIFAVLFYLDLNHSLVTIPKALWFSLKMGFYNLPFVLVITVVVSSLLYMIDQLLMMGVINVFIYPLLFGVMTNYYTKKVHDQARLYQG